MVGYPNSRGMSPDEFADCRKFQTPLPFDASRRLLGAVGRLANVNEWRTMNTHLPVVRGVPGLTGVDRLERLRNAYATLSSENLLKAIMLREFPNEVAVASSFGTESAVLLRFVAEIKPDTPILFLRTGMLFDETVEYAARLTKLLKLTNVVPVDPEPDLIASNDPDRDLWISDPDRCCYFRKVRPFKMALRRYSCWITGLKRSHGGVRDRVEPIELEEGQIKINPLAFWSGADIAYAFEQLRLPKHPLMAQGYKSVGCIPCSARGGTASSPRVGRWANGTKTECGIHTNLFATTKAAD